VHDLTFELVESLRRERSEFRGEHSCDGGEERKTCGRTLRWAAVAKYDPS
jgi:hypothetical protein